MQQLSLFSPRIRARVRCPACRAVHILAGGEAVGCCEIVIRLEESESGGFRVFGEDPRLLPGQFQPRPWIVGWHVDE